MKKFSLLLLAALIASPAIAEDYDDYDTYDDEPYVEEVATTSSSTKSDARDTYAGLRLHRNSNISFYYERNDDSHTTIRNDNFGAGLVIGNRLTNNVKLEFETLYTGSNLDRKNSDYQYDIWSNMLNVLLYKTYGGAVEPYVGMGIGVGGIWADIQDAKYIPAVKSHGTTFDMSFDLMTGINFSLNKYVDLNMGLRYVNYGKVKTKTATTHVDATEIYIGAAYKFGIFD